ncbi:MAG: hypothetical protein LBU34_01430 [Planctomycetaceae bacterium]|jgi:hypothetical protein|nr:hypothetical protein [Planctomycetaceae bacterium]
MSDLKQSGEATIQPIQKTEFSTEFDPVLEIRKLRQNLTHRIQNLPSSVVTVLNTPVLTVKENSEESEKKCTTTKETTENVKTIEKVKEFETNIILPITAKNRTEKKQTPEFPVNELVRQIHQARQLLAQLQIIPRDNKPFSEPENKKSKNITVSKFEPLETSEQFFPPLVVLKMLNTVLTWCGFFGILFSLQYLEHDNRFGWTIIAAGLILIIVGFLGRFCSFTVHQKSSNQSFVL